jgi:hypothetical protein
MGQDRSHLDPASSFTDHISWGVCQTKKSGEANRWSPRRKPRKKQTGKMKKNPIGFPWENHRRNQDIYLENFPKKALRNFSEEDEG